MASLVLTLPILSSPNLSRIPARTSRVSLFLLSCLLLPLLPPPLPFDFQYSGICTHSQAFQQSMRAYAHYDHERPALIATPSLAHPARNFTSFQPPPLPSQFACLCNAFPTSPPTHPRSHAHPPTSVPAHLSFPFTISPHTFPPSFTTLAAPNLAGCAECHRGAPGVLALQPS